MKPGRRLAVVEPEGSAPAAYARLMFAGPQLAAQPSIVTSPTFAPL
jgi:hypothetical protein